MKTGWADKMAISAAFLLLATAVGADSWELRPAAHNAPGSADIEAGRIDDAIRLLTPKLESTNGVVRLAILQNLCIAHAMKQEYELAIRYCDLAVGQSDVDAANLNNRGVVRAVTGDHRGAIQDFRRAGCLHDCSGDCGADDIREVSRRNLVLVLDRQEPTKQQPVWFHRGI